MNSGQRQPHSLTHRLMSVHYPCLASWWTIASSCFQRTINFSLKYILYQDSKETDHKADAGALTALFCLSWPWRSMSGHKNSYLHWGMSCSTSARTSLEVPPTLCCCTSHQVVAQYKSRQDRGLVTPWREEAVKRPDSNICDLGTCNGQEFGENNCHLEKTLLEKKYELKS